MRKLHVIAHWMQGISGGDRIFIELTKRWVHKFHIALFVSKKGWDICKREGLESFDYKILVSEIFRKQSDSYFYRTILSVIKSFHFKIQKDDIVLSSSDFWPDSIPAMILKFMHRKLNVKWIASFYLFAPKPWQRDSPYKGKRWFIGLFYWLSQVPIYWVIRKFADVVFVTSSPDVEKFISKNKNKNQIIVVRGGVDINPSREYFRADNIIPVSDRKYDACFVGRFHDQKGVLELVDIWKHIYKKQPNAMLVMIGVGPLEKEIQAKIDKLNLQRNIQLVGFKDGIEKYEIFKQSKIVVHPAIYDSGGMAACEAMAWGLPGVSFDLEALKTYYPKGMIKTPCNDLMAFANNVLSLLEDKQLYSKISQEAIAWAQEWDWDRRAEEIFARVVEYI